MNVIFLVRRDGEVVRTGMCPAADLELQAGDGETVEQEASDEAE